MLNYTKPRVVSQDSSSPFAMNSEKKQRGKTSNRGKKKEAVDAYEVFKQYYPVFSFAEGAKKEISAIKNILKKADFLDLINRIRNSYMVDSDSDDCKNEIRKLCVECKFNPNLWCAFFWQYAFINPNIDPEKYLLNRPLPSGSINADYNCASPYRDLGPIHIDDWHSYDFPNDKLEEIERVFPINIRIRPETTGNDIQRLLKMKLGSIKDIQNKYGQLSYFKDSKGKERDPIIEARDEIIYRLSIKRGMTALQISKRLPEEMEKAGYPREKGNCDYAYVSNIIADEKKRNRIQ